MRVLCTVAGVGRRRVGVKRSTGKAYDFQPLHITFQHDDVQGLCCAEVNIDGKEFDRLGGLRAGDARDMVLHQQNFKWVLDAVL